MQSESGTENASQTQTQTTNDLLREILVAIQGLSASGCGSSLIATRDGLTHGDGDPKWKSEHGHGEHKLANSLTSPATAEKLKRHKTRCAEMTNELNHLIAHYQLIGGDDAVIESAQEVIEQLLEPVLSLEKNLAVDQPNVRHMAVFVVIVSFGKLRSLIEFFHKSLYHQKHAFYFRDVKQWIGCLNVANFKIQSFKMDVEYDQCLTYICNELLPELEMAMMRVSDELKTFREKSLPTFLADEKERATTRYVHITTIATFFSSVTATTLQLSYAQPNDSVLGGIVNLLWFLSLVFSVSSGVSSLLGMTWRKSSIYNSHEPPKLIRLWLDKAPMVFLIFSAVLFVIGLNLFTYLSLQPQYVAVATNILTGIHSTCLLSVTAWFIYHLKYTSPWAGCVRRLIGWFRSLPGRITFPYRWLLRRPYVMHIRRNIYWALDKPSRMVDLNYSIHDLPKPIPFYPEPCFLARLARGFRISSVRYWKTTVSSFANLGRRILARCLRKGRTQADPETGESQHHDIPPTIEKEQAPSPLSAEEAKEKFKKSLEAIIDSGNPVFMVMDRIWHWERARADRCDDEWLEDGLRVLLWGLPQYINTFYAEVYPVLSPIRALNRKEREQEEQNNGGSPGSSGVRKSKIAEIAYDMFDAFAAVDAHHARTKSVDPAGPYLLPAAENAELDARPDGVQGTHR